MEERSYLETTIQGEVQAMWRGLEERNDVWKKRKQQNVLGNPRVSKDAIVEVDLQSWLPQLTPHGPEPSNQLNPSGCHKLVSKNI
jgi:hypothetical protein